MWELTRSRCSSWTDGGSILTVDNTANVADNSIVLTGQLNPASDSGLSTGTVDTTNVTQPNFFGKSEPLSTVTLSATLLPSGTRFIIGQVEAGSDGSWSITSDVPLADGHYNITATAVDQFGETTVTNPASPVAITSNLLIDTTGPVITACSSTGSTARLISHRGPGPRVGSALGSLGQHPARLVQLPA